MFRFLIDVQGMLEDLSAAMAWLSTVTVRLLRPGEASEQSPTPDAPALSPTGEGPEGGGRRRLNHVGRSGDGAVAIWRREGDEGRLVVDLRLQDEQAVKSVVEAVSAFHVASPAQHGGDQEDGRALASIRLTAVLFSQGINGLQTITNLVFMPSLQVAINQESMLVSEDEWWQCG